MFSFDAVQHLSDFQNTAGFIIIFFTFLKIKA